MILGVPYNTAVVVLGAMLLGAAAGMIGAYAVLRRRALTGDALSHAALPGLCFAFLVVGERDFQALLLGAFVSGVCGIACMSALRRWTRIKEDAAIAIVLGVFYGLGIVLLEMITKRPGGSRAGLGNFIMGKTAGMSREDLELISILAAATVLIVLLFYKEFKVVSFDAEFARVQGWPAAALDLFLQLLLLFAVVIGLPAVGVVLMAALLVIPAAAARFWTERLSFFLALAAIFGVTAGGMGAYVGSYVYDLPTGPAVILTAALLFFVSLLFGASKGVLTRRLLAPGPEAHARLPEKSPL